MAICSRPSYSAKSILARADDFADRGLGDELHHLLRLAVVEDEGLGAHEVVLDRELDVDDVLVLGQHHRFLGVPLAGELR